MPRKREHASLLPGTLAENLRVAGKNAHIGDIVTVGRKKFKRADGRKSISRWHRIA